MTKIKINTFATWESLTNVFDNRKKPVLLQIDVKNKSDERVIIDSICFSIKQNYLFFKTSKDVLKKMKKYEIRPNMTFSLKLDIQHLLREYSTDKKFNIKIISKNEVYESDIFQLGALKALNNSNATVNQI